MNKRLKFAAYSCITDNTDPQNLAGAAMASRIELANAIRALSMDAVQKASSGHPGAPMGMADIAEVLWNDFHIIRQPEVARSRPLCAVEWAWVNADLFIAASDRL